jgi:hypothetical protein
VALSAQAKFSQVGFLIGLSFGIYLALSLAEEWSLTAAIRPGSLAWKLMKLGSVTIMAGCGIYLNRLIKKLNGTPAA